MKQPTQILTADTPGDDPRLYFQSQGRLNPNSWTPVKNQIVADYWTAWQPDGTFVDQPDALDNFITANGYTRA